MHFPVREWSVDTVQHWLRDHALAPVCALFEANAVDGLLLVDAIDDAVLASSPFGFQPLLRDEVLEAIAALRATRGFEPPTPHSDPYNTDLAEPVAQWTLVDTVAKWLRMRGLYYCVKGFAKHRVTGAKLVDGKVTDEMLQEFVGSHWLRRKALKHIEYLVSTSALSHPLNGGASSSFSRL
jgi:hypothetical protein